MKSGKAIGPDDIAVEMLKALEDFGIDKIKDIANTIYHSGILPSDLTKSVFIAMPKKPGAIECELHRTISLMSHVTKTILHVLINRLRKAIRPEISHTQCGYVKDKGTRNAVFMLRVLMEKSIAKHQDIFLCFIDYTKAFDKVRHENLMIMLEKLEVDGKDLRLIRNLYWDQTAAIRIDGEVGEWKNIKRGVRQGCVMSPDLFNLYSENILRNLDEGIGVVMDGITINNLRYADDTVLIATSEADLQRLLNIVVEESEKEGLTLNAKKTMSMVVTDKAAVPGCNITIHDVQVKQVDTFCYLGSYLTSNGRSDYDIKSRIGQGKQAFIKLDNILKSNKISFKTRYRVLKSHVWSVMLYGCEAWSITTKMEKKLVCAENWCVRRMLNIHWSDHVSNEELRRRQDLMGIKPELLPTVIKRQLSFVGHIVRSDGLEKTILCGDYIGGTTSRGRPRYNLQDNIKRWTGNNISQEYMLNRKLWRAMVADAAKRHGT